MNWIFVILYILIFMALGRFVAGPGIYDRLMSLSMVNSLVVVLMCVYAVDYERFFYLDVAIVYALLSFVEVMIVVRFHPRIEGSGGRS